VLFALVVIRLVFSCQEIGLLSQFTFIVSSSSCAYFLAHVTTTVGSTLGHFNPVVIRQCWSRTRRCMTVSIPDEWTTTVQTPSVYCCCLSF